MLINLEGFTRASSLELNIGYYHIKLSPVVKQLCTIVLSWGEYKYQTLPMGVCNSTSIFQEKISELFDRFYTVHAHINDMLIITKYEFVDHLMALGKVLQKLVEAGLKVNVEKSFFFTETKYLGLWVSKNGLSPLSSKVCAIKAIVVPIKVPDVRWFVGLVDYYMDVWRKRAHTLSPLPNLCSPKININWTDTEKKAFTETKKIVAIDVLLY